MHVRSRFRVVAVLLCLWPVAPACAGHEFEFSRFANRPEWAHARALCKAVPEPVVPKPDARVAVCDETELYYGFGRPADPVAARACALIHLAQKPPIRPTKSSNVDVDLFGGAAMLATIAANGAGTPRDLDAAIGFACRINVLEDAGPDDVALMIEDFAKRRTDPTKRETAFDLCALPVSDSLAATCEGTIANRKRSMIQQARVEALSKTLDAPAQAALEKVQLAYRDFIGAQFDIEHRLRTDADVRAAWTALGDRDAQLIDRAIAAASSGIAPARAADAVASNAALDRAFAAAMRPAASGDDDMQQRRRKDVRHDQLLWRAYRSAFLAFARRAAPQTPTDGLAVVLTDERIAEVEAMRRDKIVTDPHDLEYRRD